MLVNRDQACRDNGESDDPTSFQNDGEELYKYRPDHEARLTHRVRNLPRLESVDAGADDCCGSAELAESPAA